MVDSWDRYTIEELRLDPSFVEEPKRKRRAPRIKGRFLKGPIPMDWLMAAHTKCGGAAVYVGVVLWHLSGMKRGELTFPISNVLAGGYGIARQTKHNALHSLQAAGLVQLEQRGRKAVAVTIVVEG